MEELKNKYQKTYELQLTDLISRGKREGIDVRILEEALVLLIKRKKGYVDFRDKILAFKKTIKAIAKPDFIEEVNEFYLRMTTNELTEASMYLMDYEVIGNIDENAALLDSSIKCFYRNSNYSVTSEIFNMQVVSDGLKHMDIRTFLMISFKCIISDINNGYINIYNGFSPTDQSLYEKIENIITLLESPSFSYIKVRHALDQLFKVSFSSGGTFFYNKLRPIIRLLNNEESVLFESYCGVNYPNFSSDKIDLKKSFRMVDKKIALFRVPTDGNILRDLINLEMVYSYLEYKIEQEEAQPSFQKMPVPKL